MTLTPPLPLALTLTLALILTYTLHPTHTTHHPTPYAPHPTPHTLHSNQECDDLSIRVSSANVYTASSDPANTDNKVNCYWLDRSRGCSSYGHLATYAGFGFGVGVGFTPTLTPRPNPNPNP